ncbi:hypothetical protein QR98_0013110, partial [Sarcoptes scabiei]
MMLFGKQIGRVLILIAVLEAAVLADFDSSRDEDKWWDTELSRNERQIDKESQIVQLDSLIDQDEDQTLAEYIDDKARPEFVRIPFEKKPVLIENNEPTVFGARIPVVKQEERSQNNIGQITLDRNVDTSLRPKAGILLVAVNEAQPDKQKDFPSVPESIQKPAGQQVISTPIHGPASSSETFSLPASPFSDSFPALKPQSLNNVPTPQTQRISVQAAPLPVPRTETVSIQAPAPRPQTTSIQAPGPLPALKPQAVSIQAPASLPLQVPGPQSISIPSSAPRPQAASVQTSFVPESEFKIEQQKDIADLKIDEESEIGSFVAPQAVSIPAPAPLPAPRPQTVSIPAPAPLPALRAQTVSFPAPAPLPALRPQAVSIQAPAPLPAPRPQAVSIQAPAPLPALRPQAVSIPAPAPL